MGRRKSPTLVEIKHPTVVIVIRAEMPLSGEVEDSIESALDELRGLGSAEIIERKIVGVPVHKGGKK